MDSINEENLSDNKEDKIRVNFKILAESLLKIKEESEKKILIWLPFVDKF